MKTVIGLCVLVATSLFAADFDPVAEVNPLIGTTGGGFVTPGPIAPFGMIQWSPDTPDHPTANYEYTAKEIQGFSLTHLSGTGCPNMAEFPILPTVGGADSARVGFTHDGEQSSPGFYRVVLANGVTVELTTATRSALGRFRFPASEAANLVIDANRNSTGHAEGELKSTGPREVSGWTRGGHFCGTGTSYTVYVAARADRDFRATLAGGKATLTFDTRAEQTVQLKVAISYVSEENARRNLEAENPDWDFAALRAKVENAWRERLSAIRIDGGTPSQRRIFYTALYHTLLHPNVFSDVNGETIGFDGKVRTVTGRAQYANFSGWDVYRSQLQLLTWLDPKLGSAIAASLVADAEQCGALPKWSINNVDAGVMVGDPGSAAVSAIHAFGGRDFDTAAALRFMRHSGLDSNVYCGGAAIRPAGDAYRQLGFVPMPSDGVWGPVSTTQEYAIADATIASFAGRIGDTATQSLFRQRAGNWRNLFDPASRLIRPRDASGNWLPNVDERTTDGYVEGNAAQFRWMVPQDPRGLIDALGGDAVAVPLLDQFFQHLNANVQEPYFYIGNENGFSSPWLYVWAHAPARSQDVARRVIEESFNDTIGGLPGNDDMGATSSWLVWAALGIYPAVPGEPQLTVGSPLFPHAEIQVAGSRKVVIDAPAAPARYVRALALDGRASSRPWLDQNFITRGGELRFDLVDKPTTWGNSENSAP